MRIATNIVERLQETTHRHLLLLVVAAYALAAVLPGPGAKLRHAAISWNAPSGDEIRLSLPMCLLAALLLSAGWNVMIQELVRVVRQPLALLAGTAANVLVPLGVLFLLSVAMRWWHDGEEANCLLAGLGIVAAMPIAGSSASWSQTANGSAALSLGLVSLSTFLSPLTTPLILGAVNSLMAVGSFVQLNDFGARDDLDEGLRVHEVADADGDHDPGEQQP